jgi:hypothetical protein
MDARGRRGSDGRIDLPASRLVDPPQGRFALVAGVRTRGYGLARHTPAARDEVVVVWPLVRLHPHAARGEVGRQSGGDVLPHAVLHQQQVDAGVDGAMPDRCRRAGEVGELVEERELGPRPAREFNRAPVDPLVCDGRMTTPVEEDHAPHRGEMHLPPRGGEQPVDILLRRHEAVPDKSLGDAVFRVVEPLTLEITISLGSFRCMSLLLCADIKMRSLIRLNRHGNISAIVSLVENPHDLPTRPIW